MLSYRIDAAEGIVHVLGHQGKDPAEAPRFIEQIIADPEFRPGFGFLRDRRGMEPMDAATLRSNVAQIRAVLGKLATRWAIVVSDQVNFGMMRMAGFLADDSPSEVRVFGDVEEAKRWLSETEVDQLSRRL